jgi:hypothetical protein
MSAVDFDKYMILAQILRWAKELNDNAEYSNAHEVHIAKEMRKFVASVVELEAGQ